MKEYANDGKTPEEQFFGFRLSSARMVIECGFGRLKARFGCLWRNMDIRLEELPVVIHSCLILHNSCKWKNEPINQHRLVVARKYDTEFQSSLDKNHVLNNNESGGKKIRNIYKKYFSYFSCIYERTNKQKLKRKNINLISWQCSTHRTGF